MKGNLLLIDDEPDLLQCTALLLSETADKVFTASNGEEGLEILKQNPIHCVVCDINMPGMNGVEVLERVRINHPELPFIFYTGHGSRELMQQAVKLGAFDFLDKPFIEGLEDIITVALQTGTGQKVLNEKYDLAMNQEFKKLLK